MKEFTLVRLVDLLEDCEQEIEKLSAEQAKLKYSNRARSKYQELEHKIRTEYSLIQTLKKDIREALA